MVKARFFYRNVLPDELLIKQVEIGVRNNTAAVPPDMIMRQYRKQLFLVGIHRDSVMRMLGVRHAGKVIYAGLGKQRRACYGVTVHGNEFPRNGIAQKQTHQDEKRTKAWHENIRKLIEVGGKEKNPIHCVKKSHANNPNPKSSRTKTAYKAILSRLTKTRPKFGIPAVRQKRRNKKRRGNNRDKDGD